METTKTVLTYNGMSAFTCRPTVRTESEDQLRDGTDETRGLRTILDRSIVGLRPLSSRAQPLLRARAAPAVKYGRVLVRVQRRTAGASAMPSTTRVPAWNADGVKRFTGKFPRGATKARVQVRAKPGDVPGFSVEKTIVR